MIAENTFDVISIATESGSHASIAIKLIQNSINIMIEKPIALNMKDAEEIIRESEKRGVIVSVCHQNRFNKAVQEVKQALDGGMFGKMSHSSLAVRWNRNANYYSQASWRGTWNQDGGTLMNQCIHGIDLLRWLSLGEPISVFGYTRKRIHDYIEAEDVGVAVVSFSDGSVATIEGTANVFPSNLEETVTLFGEKGTAKIGGVATNTIEIWNFSDYNMDVNVSEHIDNVYGNGHVQLFKDVASCIANGTKPYVTAEDGKKALELVLAIYKSQKTGKKVDLPLADFGTENMIGSFEE